MDDLERFIEEQKKSDASILRKDFELGYTHFKIGVLLREVTRRSWNNPVNNWPQKLNTKKSAISSN